MKDGQKILFHGEGDQEPELDPGDVIIVLDQKDHSVFQRRGQDLIMKMKIQLSEALCGFKKTIKTLDDRVLVISSKSGKRHFHVPSVLLTDCMHRGWLAWSQQDTLNNDIILFF
jgi:DnaJ-class molecular chaperone